MTELRTRIVLCNDVTANWLTNSSKILLKGEVGIEFLDDGKVKIKIGDGVKTWEQLDYFGGEALVGDDNAIVINGQTITLKGFAEAEVGAQLVKGEDGALSWVKSTQADVEDLKNIVGTPADVEAGTAASGVFADIERVDAAISNIQSAIGSASQGDTPATGLIAEIEKKANAADVYTQEEADAKIAAAVAGANHLERKIVTSINDIDVAAEDATKYIYMVANDGTESGNSYDEYMVVNGVLEHVGNTKVDLSDYITNDTFNSLKNIVDDIPNTYVSKELAQATMSQIKYEISNKPTGTLVHYGEKEIRVMCPADTAWALQNVGENGDPSKYYIGFKAYAPNDSIVSFKEDTKATIEDDTMNYFEGNDFAGTDAYGRKYSIVWLPVAAYNAETDTWTYYGANSTSNKFIGWYYSVEWYDADGRVVASDTIRINLSNESCYNSIAPFYVADAMSKAITGVKVGGTLLDIVGGQVDIPVATNTLLGVVMSSDAENKIKVSDDGTMEVNSINVNKLVQTADDVLVLNGGTANN